MQSLLLENELASFNYFIPNKSFAVSSNFRTLLQLEDEDEMTFDSIKETIQFTNKEKLKKALFKAFETDFFYTNIHFYTKKNNLKYFEITGNILLDENKIPNRLCGIIKDVTKHFNIEKISIINEEKYKIIADAMPQFVWMADKTGKLNYWNQSVFDYSGFTYTDLLEDNKWLEIVHPEDREENVKVWMNSIETGDNFFFEHRFKNSNGEYRWQLSRAIPQKNNAGEIINWIGTSTDIDDIKKGDLQKNNFIKIASHELKTPVSTIKGYAQILAKTYEDSDDLTLITSLSVINNQVNKLNTLIGDLLDLTKIELGSLPLNKENFNAQDLIIECISDLETVYPSKIFIKDLQLEEIIISADRNRIYQVISNLVTNAIKYSLTDNRVILSAKKSDDLILLSVTDFGIGIEKSEIENIFKQFYRIPGLSEKTFPGFGIGLYIVADIIKRHNGKIEVESTLGEGSTFTISLPINK